MTPQRLVAEFGARVFESDKVSAHAFGRVADTFIGSFGTFSWLIAYLTCATRIVLPYFSDLPSGSTWVPWESLFIDDDDRVRYIDCVNATGRVHWQTAREVIGAANSTFGRSMAARAQQESAERCYGPVTTCPVPAVPLWKWAR